MWPSFHAYILPVHCKSGQDWTGSFKDNDLNTNFMRSQCYKSQISKTTSTILTKIHASTDIRSPWLHSWKLRIRGLRRRLSSFHAYILHCKLSKDWSSTFRDYDKYQCVSLKGFRKMVSKIWLVIFVWS